MDKCLKNKQSTFSGMVDGFTTTLFWKKAHMILSHKSEYDTTNIPKITVNMVQFIITIKFIKF